MDLLGSALIWQLLFFTMASSHALMPFNSIPCKETGYTEGIKDLYHKTSIQGKDDRLPMSDFAKVDKSLTAEEQEQIRKSIGYVICPRSDGGVSVSSGALVGDGSVITAAHAFINSEKGQFYGNPSECFFRNQEVPPKKVMFAVSPYGKNFKSGKGYPGDPDADYAIAKLSEPVPGAKPLLVDLSGKKLKSGEQMYQVSASQENMRKSDPRQAVVQRCTAKDVDFDKFSKVFSDCDVLGGASGGVHLTRENGQLVIRAVTVNGGLGKKGQSYNKIGGVYTYSVGIDGQVLRDLQSVEPSISEGQGGIILEKGI